MASITCTSIAATILMYSRILKKYGLISSTPIDLHLITAEPEKYFDRINALSIELVTLQFEDLNGYQYKGGLTSKMGLSIVTDTPLTAIAHDFSPYDFRVDDGHHARSEWRPVR